MKTFSVELTGGRRFPGMAPHLFRYFLELRQVSRFVFWIQRRRIPL